MSCVQVHQLLDAWLDGELDSATGARIARHVLDCPDCLALKTEREALSASIRANVLPYAAPFRLRRTVRRAVCDAMPAPERRRTGPSWWQAFAMAGATGLMGVLVTWLMLHQAVPGDEWLRDELVARHVAALAGPLTEVTSTDRHIVKPWFHGKVAFAPTVRDLSSLGFTLKGARLERIAGQRAAAIVYQIRTHPVDLFVWRAAFDGPDNLQLSQARGFVMATWTAGGLRFAAVSDVDPRDLERFAREISGAGS